MEGGHDSALMLEAITAGALAGGLRYWARKDPKTARGLLKAADKQSENSRAALTTWTKGLTLERRALVVRDGRGGSH